MPTVVLWGPPCSGKTTYIAERIGPDDITVDLDALTLALNPSTDPHAESEAREWARYLRCSLVDEAAAWGLNSAATAWIVDSNASGPARARWRRMGAEVVKLTAPRATLLARAEAAGRDMDDAITRLMVWAEAHGEP